MTSFIDEVMVCGASSIGKSHTLSNIPNQDSYRIKRTKYGIVMAVCDGVGANQFSNHGSKAAAKAAEKVFKLYKKKKIKKEQIGQRLEFYYKKYLNDKYRKEAGTTCLFAFIYRDSEIIIGQAGDGLILIKLDDKFLVFQDKTDDFVNEVKALNCNYKYKAWKIRNLKFDIKTNNTLALILCTDGISEDIIPEKRDSFLEHFINLSRFGQAKLQYAIDNWDAPGSVDDKTIVTLEWRK